MYLLLLFCDSNGTSQDIFEICIYAETLQNADTRWSLPEGDCVMKTQ